MENVPTEKEVFGVNYERYALAKLFMRLQKRYQIKSVLELPASGAKAMPSLYSLGFAFAGCKVTLVDADPEGVALWRELGLEDSLDLLTMDEVRTRAEGKQRWDLCWNFVVMPTMNGPDAFLSFMKQCSRRWVMMINVNRFNFGFNMHRTVHKLWKIPWSHGDLRFFSPFKSADFLKNNGIKSIKWGVVDSPPWPDSPGFRDLRLHRLGNQQKRWVCPYIDYVKEDKFPSWMKWVYMGERFPIPAMLKLPYSHLFYILGQLPDETD